MTTLLANAVLISILVTAGINSNAALTKQSSCEKDLSSITGNRNSLVAESKTDFKKNPAPRSGRQGNFSRGLAASVSPSAPLPPGYQLVWSDEFPGNTLDTSKWTMYT